jgi:hypothetical protein
MQRMCLKQSTRRKRRMSGGKEAKHMSDAK